MLRSAVRSRLAPPVSSGTTTVSPSSSRPRTPPFHGGNRGSNPLGDATYSIEISKGYKNVTFFYVPFAQDLHKNELRINIWAAMRKAL